jgi:hypothetical protein
MGRNSYGWNRWCISSGNPGTGWTFDVRSRPRVGHEFDTDENQALLRLADELSRFSLTTGVIGMALIGPGIAAVVTGGYASGIADLAVVGLGLVAMVGGGLFLRPRASFSRITHHGAATLSARWMR